MPDEFEQPTPVVGSGDSEEEKEDKKMAIDLPENVAGMLLKEGSESHQALMTDIRHNGANVHNLVRTGAARRFNELDVTESRAVSGVLATPIAGPTTQQP